MTCWRCGSINIVRTRSSVLDRIIRLVNGKKRVTCKRCLWTARIEWNEEDDFVPRKAVLKAVESSKR